MKKLQMRFIFYAFFDSVMDTTGRDGRIRINCVSLCISVAWYIDASDSETLSIGSGWENRQILNINVSQSFVGRGIKFSFPIKHNSSKMNESDVEFNREISLDQVGYRVHRFLLMNSSDKRNSYILALLLSSIGLSFFIPPIMTTNSGPPSRS